MDREWDLSYDGHRASYPYERSEDDALLYQMEETDQDSV